MTESNCTVCRHPDLGEITSALLSGASHRQVARAFGLSASSVNRHVANGHLPELLSKVAQQIEAIAPEQLLGQTVTLYERALAMLTEAEHAQDGRLRISALGEVRHCLDALAKTAALVPTVPEGDEDLALDEAIRQALSHRVPGHARGDDGPADVPNEEQAHTEPVFVQRALAAG